MKLITLLALTLSALSAQTSITPPALTFSADAITAVQAWMVTQTKSSTTLNGAIDAATLTITVADATGITAADALVFDGEAVPIASVAGNVITLTSRGALGTVAASHADKATVGVLKYPTIRAFCRLVVRDTVAAIMKAQPVGTVATQNATISTAQAAIETAAKTGVQ